MCQSWSQFFGGVALLIFVLDSFQVQFLCSSAANIYKITTHQRAAKVCQKSIGIHVRYLIAHPVGIQFAPICGTRRTSPFSSEPLFTNYMQTAESNDNWGFWTGFHFVHLNEVHMGSKPTLGAAFLCSPAKKTWNDGTSAVETLERSFNFPLLAGRRGNARQKRALSWSLNYVRSIRKEKKERSKYFADTPKERDVSWVGRCFFH